MEKKEEKVEQVLIPQEIAMDELRVFLKKYQPKEFRRGNMTDEKIKEDYIDALEAIEDGFLIFNENGKPEYTLQSPLFEGAKDTALVVKKVSFRSRIRESDKSRLMNGLDMKKQTGTFALKYLSFITQLSMTEVDELESDDSKVINQICSVF